MNFMQFEPLVRVVLFVGVFAAMATWEQRRPRRPLSYSRWQRWPSNMGLVVLNTVVLRWLFPLGAVGVGLRAEQAHWGLLNILGLPRPLAGVAAVLLLDLAIYWQHVWFHRLPWFWRLHRMHHADLDLDVTSGTRFHTFEILLSMAIKCVVIVAIGASPEAVLAFELLLNATAMFNHSNISIPENWNRMLRLLLVTPDMHRIHHSVEREETDSNFGFSLPWWDHLFGTYRSQPRAGRQDQIVLGLAEFRADTELRFDRLLTQPWRSDHVH